MTIHVRPIFLLGLSLWCFGVGLNGFTDGEIGAYLGGFLVGVGVTLFIWPERRAT